MEKQKIFPVAIVIIILLLLFNPTPANAGGISFMTKLAIFFKNSVDAMGLTVA